MQNAELLLLPSAGCWHYTFYSGLTGITNTIYLIITKLFISDNISDYLAKKHWCLKLYQRLQLTWTRTQKNNNIENDCQFNRL